MYGISTYGTIKYGSRIATGGVFSLELTETVTHTDLLVKTPMRTFAETINYTATMLRVCSRSMTETVNFFNYLLKGASEHLHAAKLIFQENFEGGKLPGNFGRSITSATGALSIDTTGKVSGNNSVKVEVTGEGNAVRLVKNFGATYNELYFQFKITIPADFNFNGTTYFSILNLTDALETTQLCWLNLENWGNLRLTLGGWGWTDTGISLVPGNTYRIELYVKFDSTTGAYKIWVDNDNPNSPNASASGLNTGTTPAGAFRSAENYSDGAHTPYYVDDYFVAEEFIGRFPTVLTQVLTETITFTASMLKGGARILTETATFTASLLKGGLRNLTETVTHSDTLEALRAIVKTLTETLTHTDTATRDASRTMTETTTHTDAITRGANREITETATHTDDLTKGVMKIQDLLESVTHTATMIRGAVRNLAETVSHSDTLTTFRSVFRVLTETVTHTDSRLAAISRTFTEQVTHTSALVKSTVRTLTETVTHSDTITKLRTAYAVLADTATHTASLVKMANKTFTETVTHTAIWRAWRNGLRAGIWKISAKISTTWTKSAKIVTSWTKSAKKLTTWTKTPKP